MTMTMMENIPCGRRHDDDDGGKGPFPGRADPSTDLSARPHWLVASPHLKTLQNSMNEENRDRLTRANYVEPGVNRSRVPALNNVSFFHHLFTSSDHPHASNSLIFDIRVFRPRHAFLHFKCRMMIYNIIHSKLFIQYGSVRLSLNGSCTSRSRVRKSERENHADKDFVQVSYIE